MRRGRIGSTTKWPICGRGRIGGMNPTMRYPIVISSLRSDLSAAHCDQPEMPEFGDVAHHRCEGWPPGAGNTLVRTACAQPRPTAAVHAMPRLAANLAYLFTERPFMERFAAAAAAGFTAVELQFPYDHAPSAVKAELEQHGLTMLGLNTRARQYRGRRVRARLRARPRGRIRERCSGKALDYVVAIGGRQIHVLAGKLPPEQRRPARPSSSAISCRPPTSRRRRTSRC